MQVLMDPLAPQLSGPTPHPFHTQEMLTQEPAEKVT